MSISLTCHLSSLSINSGDEVIVIPVSYGNVGDSSLVYGESEHCNLAWLPMIATCEDYGQLKLSDSSRSVCSIFLDDVNSSLMNNEQVKKEKDNAPIYFGKSYYLFKRDSFNEALRGEFLTDTDCIARVSNQERLLDIEKIESGEELFAYLAGASLMDVNQRSVQRYSRIVIRKDIFDSLVERQYTEHKEKTTQRSREYVSTMATNTNPSVDHLQSRVAGLVNGSQKLAFAVTNTARYAAYAAKAAGINDKPLENEALVESIVLWSLVARIYREVGKSFYPNVRRHHDMEPIHALSSVIVEKVENKVSNNLKYWAPENGYDAETQQQEKWND